MLLTLALLATPAAADDRAGSTPGVSADPPGEVMPTRWWDMVSLHLDLRLDIDAGTVSGTATHDIAPLAQDHGALRLHQVGLDISEIRVDGAAIDGWRTGRDFVEIPVTPAVSHTVAVTYSASPQSGLHFRGPQHGDRIREVWSQGEGEDNRHWFPGWDYPNDRMTLELDLTVKDGLTALANGTLEGSAPAAEAGWTTWSWSMPDQVVNYLVALSVGEYQATRLEGRIPLEIWTAKGTPETQARAGLDAVAEMLPYFDELLGTPYAYPAYRQVAVQRFMYGGMENTTLTILSDGLLVTEPWRHPRNAEAVAAHELAHQWFGDLLTCYGWRELWLNEGFASHYTNRWMDHAYGEAYAAHRRRRMYEGGLNTNAPMAARSWSRVAGRDNTAVYTRGSTVLHMLEVYLGRDTFDAGIQRYTAVNRDRLVETGDLRRAMEEVSGVHLGWLFDQWVHRAGAPVLDVHHKHQVARDDRPGQLTVVIEQKPDGPAWYAPVEVEIGTADGSLRRSVWVGEGQTRLVLDIEEPPRWVIADPQRGVLARWTQRQDPKGWIAAARHSPSWDARIEAVHQLGKGEADDGVVEALAAFLGDRTTDPDVRQYAATALGDLGTDAARDALLAAFVDPEPRIREAVVSQLGGTPVAEQTWRVVDRAATSDPHEGVRAAALSALASLDADRALPRVRRAVSGKPDAPGATVDRAIQLLGAHGTRADLGRILRYVDASAARGPRHAAIDAASKIASREEDDALRARVSRALEPGLGDVDQRTRRATIDALGRCGDEQAARRLQAYAKQTHLEPHAARALDAARDIRAHARGEPDKPAKDDLDRVGERLEEMERRIEELETWK